ncbi:hypothetical protein ACJX0J_023079 [Zea mays]
MIASREFLDACYLQTICDEELYNPNVLNSWFQVSNNISLQKHDMLAITSMDLHHLHRLEYSVEMVLDMPQYVVIAIERNVQVERMNIYNSYPRKQTRLFVLFHLFGNILGIFF